jgi:hypothetical protein
VSEQKRPPSPDPSHLEQRTAELHEALRLHDPQLLARRTGTTYAPVADSPDGVQQGSFHLHYWGRPLVLSYPEFVTRDHRTREPVGPLDEAMLAYYFALSDGTPETGDWVSFSDLPDGRFYTQAFQGYTGDELAKVMGNDESGFVAAAGALGGEELASGSLGDRAFAFRALPYVSLLVVCWLGDEDFPPSYRLLFDSAVKNHLSTDACAILGSGLTRRLLKTYLAAGHSAITGD